MLLPLFVLAIGAIFAGFYLKIYLLVMEEIIFLGKFY